MNLKLKNISELRLLWAPGDGWYVGREYWDSRKGVYEVCGMASLPFFKKKIEARESLKRLIQNGASLSEGTAVGVYMDLMQYGEVWEREDHRTAVFAALTVEERVTDFRGMQDIAV